MDFTNDEIERMKPRPPNIKHDLVEYANYYRIRLNAWVNNPNYGCNYEVKMGSDDFSIVHVSKPERDTMPSFQSPLDDFYRDTKLTRYTTYPNGRSLTKRSYCYLDGGFRGKVLDYCGECRILRPFNERPNHKIFNLPIPPKALVKYEPAIAFMERLVGHCVVKR